MPMRLTRKGPAPLHVLLLTDNLKVGGVQKVVVNFSEMLTAASITTSVSASSEGPLWEMLPDTVQSLPAPSKNGLLSMFRYIFWLRRTVANNGITIVHAHQRGVALAAKAATLGTRVAVVEHVHSVFSGLRVLSFHGDLLIACGSSVARVLTETYRKRQDKVHTILNSVPDLAPEGASHVPSENGTLPRLIGVGRLTSVKDPLKFVRLVSRLNSGPELSVTAAWLGDGELRSEAEALAKELNCRGLSFLGAQTDVASHIREADLLVLTSKREGLPLAVLEAMSLGRGVIVPDVGSCSDAVIHGQNGILYDPDVELEDLVELVKHALAPPTLSSWGKKSRELYNANFHPNTSLPKLLQVYSKALGVKRPPIWSPQL